MKSVSRKPSKPYVECKVHGPYVLTLRNQNHVFEHYMTRLVVMKGHQKDMRNYGIRQCIQNTNMI